MEAELAFSIDNPDNDLKTLDPKLTLKDLDEAKQIAGGQKDDPNDDAIEQMTTWTKQHRQSWQDWQTQRKEDEVSQTPKDSVNHDDGASANQVTSATILNIANIRIKNNTTVMVSDLPSRHELHGQIRNKRNIRDMKRVRKRVPCPATERGDPSAVWTMQWREEGCKEERWAEWGVIWKEVPESRYQE
jgi:hypothetical protein